MTCFTFTRCPRCSGNPLPDDERGVVCLQCGWYPSMSLDYALLIEKRNQEHGNKGSPDYYKTNGRHPNSRLSRRD